METAETIKEEVDDDIAAVDCRHKEAESGVMYWWWTLEDGRSRGDAQTTVTFLD